MKLSEVKKPFLGMVEDLLLVKGFEKIKTNDGFEYVLKSEYGFNSVTPIINHYNPLVYISLSFGLRINAVSEITTLFSDISEEYRSQSTTLNLGFDSLTGYSDNRIKIETSEELIDGLAILKRVLENGAMDFFSKYKTIEDFDKEINRENRPKNYLISEVSQRPFLGVTCAILNNNPGAVYWGNYYKKSLVGKNPHLINQFEKLMDYLHLKHN